MRRLVLASVLAIAACAGNGGGTDAQALDSPGDGSTAGDGAIGGDGTDSDVGSAPDGFAGDTGTDGGRATDSGTDGGGSGDTGADGSDGDAGLCLPECDGKECGADGCGGECGKCPQAAPECWGDFLCHKVCMPDCEGKECGADGCGGECGQCPQAAPECGADSLCHVPSPSSLGTAFWAVDLDAFADPYAPIAPDASPYAVWLVNPGDQEAAVTLSSPSAPLPAAQAVVPALGSLKLVLQSAGNDGSGVFDTAVHITSDKPIGAFQVNPEDPQAGSNGSSLLLPEPFMGMEYRVLSWPTSPLEMYPVGVPSQHGFFAVVAPGPGNTTVKVTPSVRLDPAPPEAGPLVPGQTYQFTLPASSVLQLQADGSAANDDFDPSGTVVIADKPVALLAGHEEAAVCGVSTDEICCADQMEEQLLPTALWGDLHVCPKTKPRGAPDKDVYRVMAGADGVELATVPPVAGADGVLIVKAGDWIEFAAADGFVLSSSGPVQVIQYLAGSGCAGSKVGDPEMILVLPWDFKSKRIPVQAPALFAENYITIVREVGTVVTVSPPLVGPIEFSGIGNGFEMAYVELDEALHLVESSEPVQTYAYGYDSTLVAWGHPAGY